MTKYWVRYDYQAEDGGDQLVLIDKYDEGDHYIDAPSLLSEWEQYTDTVFCARSFDSDPPFAWYVWREHEHSDEIRLTFFIKEEKPS